LKINNDKIDVLLAERNLSYKDLAALMGICCGSLHALRYKSKSVRPRTVNKIAGALGVNVADIVA